MVFARLVVNLEQLVQVFAAPASNRHALGLLLSYSGSTQLGEGVLSIPPRFTKVILLTELTGQEIAETIKAYIENKVLSKDKASPLVSFIMTENLNKMNPRDYQMTLFDVFLHHRDSIHLLTDEQLESLNCSHQIVIRPGTQQTLEKQLGFLVHDEIAEIFIVDQYFLPLVGEEKKDLKIIRQAFNRLAHLMESMMVEKPVQITIVTSTTTKTPKAPWLKKHFTKAKEEVGLACINRGQVRWIQLLGTHKGIFHARQLFTNTYRMLFDTRVDAELHPNHQWNNTFEIHPHFYDCKGVLRTTQNQLRLIHLHKVLYYLSVTLKGYQVEINSPLLQHFQSVYPEPNASLKLFYPSEIQLEDIQVFS